MATSGTKYIEGIGRRKEAVARVRLTPSKSPEFKVNGKELVEYFPVTRLSLIAKASLNKLEATDKFSVSVKVNGGGIKAQAEAIRLGVARALVKDDAEARPTLKSEGFLKRDARVKERKKFGLRKARRAPQWSKR